MGGITLKFPLFTRIARAAHLWRMAWAESNRPEVSRRLEGNLIEVRM
jgi:hypothetical protein